MRTRVILLSHPTGLGYEDHKNGKRNGARLLRLEKTNNFSVHDIILVDAPMFHFVLNTVTNGEAYNMAIRGGDWGGLDGVDVIGTNLWIHDVRLLLYTHPLRFLPHSTNSPRSW